MDNNPELVRLIRDEITRTGPMTFARFMDLALYAPGLGYYMRDADRIGAAGDYYTSGNLSMLFGEMVARQLLEMAERCGGPAFTVIEQGAGKGLLAHDILSAFERVGESGARIAYLIIERSPAMKERQRRMLEPWVASGRLAWRETLPASIEGCVFSNELIDAFPVHRVVGHEGRLAELYVGLLGDGFADVVGPPSTPELEAYLNRARVRLAEGQHAEINLAAVEWMRAVGRALRRGFVLTVDYGYTADDRYAPERTRGTLLAYHQHRTNEAFYERIGRQDLTAHVDWTTQALVGREEGLEVAGWTDQTSFLLGLGAAEAAESSLAEARDDAERERMLAGLRGLLDPQGMGRIFQVLIQNKGLAAPSLRGLGIRSSSPISPRAA